ncbi:MAG: hypothetical protein P4N59_17795 [Negativicutes bacterium]|nr:hypothetical protein [Negativicutes bacterium]
MKRLFIIFLAFMLIPAIAFCSTTKVLNQDTDFCPQGWTAGSLNFKHGTTVELNDRGQVISGVLNHTYTLRPAGVAFVAQSMGMAAPYHSWYIYYQSDTSVTFDEHGWVLSGTTASDTDVYLIPNVEPLIKLRKGSVISFDKDRNLISGTIDDNTFLHPAGWTKFLPNSNGILKFKAGTEVVLGPNAQVIKGTIAEDLTVNLTTVSAGTTLQFSEFGIPQRI